MITERELQTFAFQLAAMRNQLDAMMLTVESGLAPVQGNNESSELEKKTRSYFGGQRESPDNPQSGREHGQS